MKRVWLGEALLVMIGLPVFGQKKEQDRVANAGSVMHEILNISRRYSAECYRQSGLLAEEKENS
jgi:hypothetical protein